MHHINYKHRPVLVEGDKLPEGMVTHHLEYDDKNPLAHTVIVSRAEHIRIHHIGKKRTPEQIERMRKARWDKPQSPETLYKIGSANRGRKLSRETKEKMSKARTGRKNKPETLLKMSESAKKRWLREHEAK